MTCRAHLAPTVSTPTFAAPVKTVANNDPFAPQTRKGVFKRFRQAGFDLGFLSEAAIFSTIEASIDLKLELNLAAK